MNGHDTSGIAAYGPQEDNQERAWAEMGLREEHEEWMRDPAAQLEYREWKLATLQHDKDTHMRTSQMMESKYLKKEDVGEGKLVTIKHIKKENLAKEDETAEFKFIMFFDELDKGLVLNSTNIQLAEKALGSDESDHWLGKQIVLYEDPNVSYGGKLVGGIRIRAVRRKVAPTQAAPRSVAYDPDGVDRDDIPF